MPRPIKPHPHSVVSTGTSPAFGPKKTGSTGTSPAFTPNKSTVVTGAEQLPGDKFANASKAVTQLTGRDAVRTPGQLSELGDIGNAEELPGRLNVELALHLPELVSLLSLTRQQKATRLVEFLVPYAIKLAELSTAAALAPGQRARLEEKLLTPMSTAGLEQVIELGSGKTGVEVARELLSAATPEDAKVFTQQMTFDAPTWASRPETAAANEVKRGEPSLQAQPAAHASTQPTIQPLREQNLAGRFTPEEEQQQKDRGDRKLGKNMVWNVLHMLRGGEEGALPEEQKKQQELIIATGAILVLVITVALVIVLAMVLGG